VCRAQCVYYEPLTAKHNNGYTLRHQGGYFNPGIQIDAQRLLWGLGPGGSRRLGQRDRKSEEMSSTVIIGSSNLTSPLSTKRQCICLFSGGQYRVMQIEIQI
jgi:hypothetical protein